MSAPPANEKAPPSVPATIEPATANPLISLSASESIVSLLISFNVEFLI